MTVENKSLLKATGIISIGTLLSRVFGFIRDMVIAMIFGAGMATDAFFVAFKIPNLLRRLLGEGALSAAFIPLFTEYSVKRSDTEAWKFASAVLSSLFLVLIALVLLALYGMPGIISVLAPGFLKDQEKFELAVSLTRVTFPYILFISIAALFMGILNSMRRFVVPAFSPVLLNFALIGAAFFICPYFSPPVKGLAIGVLLGGIFQLTVYVFAMKKAGMKLRPDFTFTHPGIKRVVSLMGPSVIALGVTQINIFFDTLIASFLKEGSISYLYYADRVMQLPLGVFGTAIGTAILPSLSLLAAKDEYGEMASTISFGLRFAFFITLPASVALIVLSTPIISLLFGRGSFEGTDVAMTAQALSAFSAGIVAYSGIKVLSPVYFALKDTKTPVKIAVASMLVNIVLNVVLMWPFRHAGIALATAISAILNFALLTFFLKGKIDGIKWREVRKSVSKVLVASLVMGTGCFFAYYSGYEYFSGPVFSSLWLFLVISGGIVLFFLSARLLQCEELVFLQNIVQKKWAGSEK
ncbi:MAG: murein biosynthesis integral membrane protein MurJ [Nitrospinota bacterium]